MSTTRCLLFLSIVFCGIACEDRLTNADRRNLSKYEEAEEPMEVQAVSIPPLSDQSQSTEMVMDRKMIRNGVLSIEVADVEKIKAEVEKICKESKAYTASETQNNYDYRRQYEQVIRVPGMNFDTIVKRLEALGSSVETKSIYTNDVTAEFIDIEARIKTKKALEERYLDILKKAVAVKDMLEIEGQLSQVRGEIESMEGRLKYLTNQVSYSTLTFTFYQSLKNDYGFGNKIVASISNGWDMLLAFFIGILNIWPFLILAIGGIYLLVRKIRNRQGRLIES
jgi:hypothetical protein